MREVRFARNLGVRRFPTKKVGESLTENVDEFLFKNVTPELKIMCADLGVGFWWSCISPASILAIRAVNNWEQIDEDRTNARCDPRDES